MKAILFALVVGAIACSYASASTATATGLGGTSISTARPLPLNRLVTSGWVDNDGGEFFRVNLHTGDRLTLDYGVVGSSCSTVHVWIYAPNVTDFTLGNSDSVADQYTNRNAEFKWIAPINGGWIVHFADCSTNSYRVKAAVKPYRVPVVISTPTIAHARPLPVNRLVASGWVDQDPGEFWRVRLRTGQRVTIDYGVIGSNCSTIHVWIYAPNVTDFTLGSANSIADQYTNSSSEFVWTAPRAGSWIVHFADCSTNAFKFKVRLRRR